MQAQHPQFQNVQQHVQQHAPQPQVQHAPQPQMQHAPQQQMQHAQPQVQHAPQQHWQDVSRMSVDHTNLPHTTGTGDAALSPQTIQYIVAGVVILLLLGAIGVGVYVIVKGTGGGSYKGGHTGTLCTSVKYTNIAPPATNTVNGTIAATDLQRYYRCCLDRGAYKENGVNMCCVDASGNPVTCPSGDANPWKGCSGVSYHTTKSSLGDYPTQVGSCMGSQVSASGSYKDYTEMYLNDGATTTSTSS